MFVPCDIRFLRLYTDRSHSNDKKEIISLNITNQYLFPIIFDFLDCTVIDNLVTTKKK